MKIGAIIQARMSSRRFPGKVLHTVKGKPLLMYIIERLQKVSQFAGIIVATSSGDDDKCVKQFCADNGILCYRGDLDNVVARFTGALDVLSVEAFVRVNGDSPLIDPRLIENGIEMFLKGEYDIVTNVFPRSFPKGQSVEIVSSEVFKRTEKNIIEKDDREHVTRYFYNNAEKFHIYNISSSSDLSHIQLSVDTAEDMKTFEGIASKMDRPHWTYGLKEVLELYNSVVGEG